MFFVISENFLAIISFFKYFLIIILNFGFFLNFSEKNISPHLFSFFFFFLAFRFFFYFILFLNFT